MSEELQNIAVQPAAPRLGPSTRDFTVLLIEDERLQLERLEREIGRREPRALIVKASNAVSACNQFRKYKPEVVIVDLGLNGAGPSGGLQLISQLACLDPSARIVTLTGHTGDEVGHQAIKSGAASFMIKPADMVLLHSLIRDYVQTARFKRGAVEREEQTELPGFVGVSAAMRNVYRLIRLCAATDLSVLIVGETGTGKELVARAVHELSVRRNGPLSIYFGSVPEHLSESELFGYVRGAFTGADSRGKRGCLQAADGGTLFIDELCSLSAEIQRKLLRAVEERTFKPVGSERYQTADFRLVCAAQPRIYELVSQGRFREDLLARIEIFTIILPPLRDREGDVPALARYFLKQARMEIEKAGRPCSAKYFAPEVLRAFHDYDWPRNVRELRHVVHQGAVQAQLRGSETIELEDVAFRLPDRFFKAESRAGKTTLKQAVDALERKLIVESLSRHQRCLSAVCRELGVGRTTLWRKLKTFGIEM